MSVKRIRIICYVIMVSFVGLIAKVAYIQFFSSEKLAEAAFEQRLSNTRIEKLRGNILDRKGIPFTNRTENYTAFIKPASMPESREEREKVCSALGIEADLLDELTSKSKPLLIRTDKAGSEKILEMNTDWISILKSLDRYDEGTLAKHVLGYLNKKDQIGQSGIEKLYENELKDSVVFEIGTVTDAAKKPIKGLGYRLKARNADKKLNVRLTLDYHIQKIVEDIMDKYGISGAVVLEDVVTGDILAMASRPDFNQNAIEDYLDSDGKELFNKATAAYNLGSVFKIVDAAAYFENEEAILEQARLEDLRRLNQYDVGDGSLHIGHQPESAPTGVGENTANEYENYLNAPDTAKNNSYPDSSSQDAPYVRREFRDPEHYYCSGAVDIGSLVFRCSSYYEGGHGDINMERAFALSCNSYFIELSRKVGYMNLIEMAQKFGLGSYTGLSDQGIYEARGSLPQADGSYSQADIANLAIGQGLLLATPVQVADMVATVANGGIKNRVNIVDSIIDSEGKVIRNARVDEGQRIISKSTSDKVRRLMEAVTSYGTGTGAIMGYYGGAGGKTGSAETGYGDVVHAWFAGYFPAKTPRYSIAVFVENGRLGGKVAAPVFAEIAKAMLQKGY